MSDLLQLVVSEGASDLHVRVGTPPTIRVHGILHRVEGPALSADDSEELMRSITSEDHIQHVRERGGADFGFAFADAARFRVSVFKEKGNFGVVLRQIPNKLLTMEEIGIPPSTKELLYKPRGLVLVTGPTGSGKTTTLASMINIINEDRDEAHIVTIEDPIEYLFKDQKGIVSQREIGLDTKDYEEALTYLMRQDPDVVFVGEMRDARTVAAGMRASETGHLVFGTLHSANASQAIHRLLDLFPQNERDLVRQALTLAIKAVISQVLLPCIQEGVGRIPAVEILISNAAARKLIAEGREADLPSVIRSSAAEGMQDLTYNLCELVKAGLIDPKDAYKHAPNVEELKMALKGITTTASGIL